MYVSRSRFDLFHREAIQLDDSPLYLIPVAQGKATAGEPEFFVGLRGIEARRHQKYNKNKLLDARITLIITFLGIIRQIASQSLPNTVLESYDDIIEWFLKIVFEGTPSSLPIFGWVHTSSPYHTPPEELFGSAKKCLSLVLNKPGIQLPNETCKTSIYLFEFWYEEAASKHNLLHLNDLPLPSFQELLDSMAGFLQSHRI